MQYTAWSLRQHGEEFQTTCVVLAPSCGENKITKRERKLLVLTSAMDLQARCISERVTATQFHKGLHNPKLNNQKHFLGSGFIVG